MEKCAISQINYSINYKHKPQKYTMDKATIKDQYFQNDTYH